MAAAVTSATSPRTPARSASISITSPWTSVESTSITISRFARRLRPAGWTARSIPCETASAASSLCRVTGSVPETSNSIEVTGYDASRTIRSMLAPSRAIRWAIAATGAGRNGWPRTVTWARSPAGRRSFPPGAISISRPNEPAACCRSARSCESSAWPSPVRRGRVDHGRQPARCRGRRRGDESGEQLRCHAGPVSPSHGHQQRGGAGEAGSGHGGHRLVGKCVACGSEGVASRALERDERLPAGLAGPVVSAAPRPEMRRRRQPALVRTERRAPVRWGERAGSGSAARPERRSSSSWVTSGRQAATSSRARVEPAAMSSSVSACSSSRSAGTGGGGCADRHAQLTRCPWSPGGPNVVTVGTSATSAPTQITASPAATASTVRSRGRRVPAGHRAGSATRSARAP